MTHLCHGKVPQYRIVLANLEVTHAKFLLLIFECAFHGPATEADMQDRFKGRARGSIGEEVFFFAWIEDVAGIDEPIGTEHLASATNPERSPFDFPDHGSLVRVFEVNALPSLPQHDARMTAQGFDVAIDGAGFAVRIAEPAVKTAAYLGDVALLEIFESAKEFWAHGVPFVEGDPAEHDPTSQGPTHLLQSDLILGPVDDLVGDACFGATFRIIPAVLRQEKIAVEHGSEVCVVTGIAKVDADDAVVDLTRVAAPLTLHASGFGAGLGMAGVIDNADGLGIRMVACDDMSNAFAHPTMLPFGPTEKLLKSPSGRSVVVGNRLHALTGQIGELTANVTREVAARLGPSITVIELAQVIGQLRAQRKDLCGGHP